MANDPNGLGRSWFDLGPTHRVPLQHLRLLYHKTQGHVVRRAIAGLKPQECYRIWQSWASDPYENLKQADTEAAAAGTAFATTQELKLEILQHPLPIGHHRAWR